ncbi:MAG TPA: hypothetical protein VLL05_14460 [Terriglobales bacterium]|nr:hypothetical protein [Terriglobales bacterium]
MKLFGRILVGIIALVALSVVSINWILPVGLSFYAAKRAPKITRVVPQPLQDNSISEAPSTKLSYFGYEFEVPWTDLDDSLTTLYPKDKPDKNRADLHFRSGLRLVITAIPPQEWARNLAQQSKASPQELESVYGPDIRSDYLFVRDLFEFTPDKMNHWGLQRDQPRGEMLLIIKSITLLKSAESGIFVLQNPSYKGFQEGDPRVRQDGIGVHLFADDGSIEIIFLQKDYNKSEGVTQAEINRIVQSLRKTQSTPTKSGTTPSTK